MRFGVLGPLRVWTADGRPVGVPEAKVRALLADLLIHQRRPVSADRLVDDLWGEEPPGKPTAALRAKVSQLRRAFEDAEPGGRELVVSGPAGYLLQVDAGAVDVDQFEALIARARGIEDPHAKAELLARALELWRGPAFADFGDEPFARAAIGRLDEQRLVVLEERAEARLELGEHSLLAGELGELVALYPLRERLRAAHVRALYRSGRQTEALDSYNDLRDRLVEELGLDPSPELVALRQAILEQDPVLETVPPQPTPEGSPRTNLPTVLTDLVGRGDELGEVRSLLGTGRLVTLTGPGGVGKTRLAVEAATGMTDAYPDGVWLVELAALTRPTGADVESSTIEAVQAVATVLGVRDDATSTGGLPPGAPVDLADRLAGALRTKRMLLVLDSCEHVVGSVVELAGSLLRAAPGLRILATSREPLGLAGELLHVVPPLELSDPTTVPEVSEQASAVRLFVERAAAAAPGFTLDADNAEAVATLCRRLDGIPLALELAATRVRALGVHQLSARLCDRFRLLNAGHRSAPERQRTLQAVIDWSWELLTEPERTVLRRLAVHTGGCTLGAAEEVCAGESVPATEVADLLGRLVDRSLVVVGGDANIPRYQLLESVAAYCTERLHEAGEHERVRQRHYRYYTALVECAEVGLRGHTQREWLQRMDAEAANLRGALDSAAHHDDADRALRLVNAMAWYWVLRGRLEEGRRSLAVALAASGDAPAATRTKAEAWQVGVAALAGDGTDLGERSRAVLRRYEALDDPRGRATAEWFLGFALLGGGDQSASEDLIDRALAGFRALDDHWGVAAALGARAEQAIGRGDLDALERDGEHSLVLFRELGDRWGQLQAMEALDALAEITGDYDQAARLRRDGLRIAEHLGLWTEVPQKLAGLGRLALLAGDHAQAEELHERARRLAAECGDKPGELFAQMGLGLGARRQGRFDVAEAHLRHWLDWCRRVDWQPGLALLLAELGFVAEQRGNAEAALATHRDGHVAAQATGDPRAVALALEGLAGARALAGDPVHAARLLGTAAATRESVGAPLPPAERGDVDRITAAVRSELGEGTFVAEFERGGEREPEQNPRLSASPEPADTRS